MKIDILTLFPEMFDGFKSESIIKRAIDLGKVTINTCNFRDFSEDKHKKVDDTPYGGGAGMVLKCQPIFDALKSVKKENSKVILLSPQGVPYNQKMAYELSKEEHLILVCGHYEGFDERIKSVCDEEMSIGDYVLTGGELPAMVITDSVVRLIPGVIDEESHLNDSFNNNLLDYPTYTKPRDYNGMKVPEVLLSGDHEKIKKWREEKQLEITKEKRPDLIKPRFVLKKEGLKKSGRRIKIDDVKDIKVTIIKDNKNLSYKVTKEEKLVAITIFNPKELKGYKLKGKSKDGGITKILIVKKAFAFKVALKNIRKKIDVLANRLNAALFEIDEDKTRKVLAEAEMLKQMIINTYQDYLGKERLDGVIKNINQLVSEFVRSKTLHSN